MLSFSLNTGLKRPAKFLLKTLFIFCVLSFLTIGTKAQTQFSYDIQGTVTKSGKRVDGAVITLFKGSSQVAQVSTSGNGKFDMKLDLGFDYTMTVTKAGCITKKFFFSTKGVPDDVAKGYEGGSKPEISIFEMPKDPNIVSQINSILSQPMAKFMYDDRQKDIVFDKPYSQSMLEALERLGKIEKEAIKKEEEEAKQKQNLESAAASKYEAAIMKGDAAFAKKDYTTARVAYEDALSIKPGEAYPKGKIIEIEKLIADAAKNAAVEADYKAAISKADASFTSKNYEVSKTFYTEASKLKPAEAYPKTKLAEIDKLLADAAKGAELEAKYKAAIAKGDAALAGKTYEGAKTAYNEALGLKPAEKYPKDKIAEIDKILADILAKEKADKELNDKYKALIANGDKAFTDKLYSFAKPQYEEALKLKPAESYPKAKLAEIEKLMADSEAKAKAEKELEEKYKAAIAKGDKGLAAKDYSGAKGAYSEALGLKAAEQYPKDKIAEIDKILGNYTAAIAKADASFKAKKYEEAKTSYNEALTIKSSEQYPKDKIAEIDGLLAKDAAAKELNDKYNAVIAKADAAFTAKTYDIAKTTYNEALGIKAAETYPKTKIAEIDKILADLAAKEKAEADKLAKAKELEEKYKAAIAKADASFGSKDYASAKGSYSEALALKATEKYPKDKITEIDAILAKEMGAKQLEEKYKAAIAKGDAALSKKDYTTAKAGFTEAVGLKAAEQYPKDKLAEIDKALADLAAEKEKEAAAKALEAKYKAAIAKGDAALKAKTFDPAKTAYNEALGIKPGEQYPKDKIAEIDALIAAAMGAKELDDKYKAAVAKGDAALKAKTYDPAKAAYNEALGFKPAEAYPKTKLAEIDKILADIAAKEKADADKLAKEKELTEKYNAAIAKGDAALSGKEYEPAKAAYNEALGFKPAEKYPKDKIAEINAILAKEMGAKQLELKYAEAIKKGDDGLAAKEYVGAKAGYTAALALKPNEQYPKDKLVEVEKALAEIAAAKDKEAAAKALEAKYKAAIAKGDAALKLKSYEPAKAAYNEALGIKSEEQYPKDKIAEINTILAEIANKNASAKELEEKYKAALAKGDAGFAAKDYDAAKAGYNEALGIKPAEKYPKDKIAAIDALLAKELGAKEKEEKYKAALAKADEAFTAKDYTAAKTGYTEASGIKPSELYPKDQITKINALLADLAKGKALQDKYDAAIGKGDGAMGTKDYTTALAAYKEAQTLKPSEPYPGNKIAEINKAIDAAAKAKEKEKQYLEVIAKADKLFGVKDYKAAKSNYLDAGLIKPTEKYPKEKVAECDVLLKKKTNNTTTTATNNKNDFISELAKKYPEGITEESATENNAKVIRRIVVRGSEGHMYVKKTTSFGPIYYFKDDTPITEDEFNRDTEVQPQY